MVQVRYFEDLTVGDTASASRTVAEGDLTAFADVTGDHNPVHLDAAYAATTPFKQRIAHGMLSAGYISAVLGTKLPGHGSIYLSQNLRFRAPVLIGDTVETVVKVEELDARRKRVRLTTVCSVSGKPVVDGEAWMLVPARPA